MSRLVTVVIPTFREEEIVRTLERLGEFLVTQEGAQFEIVVVDDSDEAVRESIRGWWSGKKETFFGKLDVVVMEGPHRGKGAAVREGVLASRGDAVFTMDADLPVPLEHITDFLRRIDEGADVVVGERPMTRNMENPLRFVLSRGLDAFQRFVIFGEHVFDDTQCGFKAFRGTLARELASKQGTDGGMYDIEYLFVAHRAGARIERVSVVPNPEWRSSKINAWKALRQDPGDLLRVKWRSLTGKYD